MLTFTAIGCAVVDTTTPDPEPEPSPVFVRVATGERVGPGHPDHARLMALFRL